MVTCGSPARLIGVNWADEFHWLCGELAVAFRGDGPPDFGAMARPQPAMTQTSSVHPCRLPEVPNGAQDTAAL